MELEFDGRFGFAAALSVVPAFAYIASLHFVPLRNALCAPLQSLTQMQAAHGENATPDTSGFSCRFAFIFAKKAMSVSEPKVAGLVNQHLAIANQHLMLEESFVQISEQWSENRK